MERDHKNKSPSRAELIRELDATRSRCRWDKGVKIAQTLIRWGGAVLIAGFIYLSIDSLKGLTTQAQIGIGLSANVNADICETSPWEYVTIAISFIFGFFGIAYGWLQRELRRNTIETLAPYRQQVEQQLDSRRTSSGLSANGTTHPEDE